MPDCPVKTLAERIEDGNNLSTRWEFVVGKALKDWATALMQFGMTREEARNIVLSDIKEQTERVKFDYEEKKKGGMVK
jgi:hypothetical protein